MIRRQQVQMVKTIKEAIEKSTRYFIKTTSLDGQFNYLRNGKTPSHSPFVHYHVAINILFNGLELGHYLKCYRFGVGMDVIEVDIL